MKWIFPLEPRIQKTACLKKPSMTGFTKNSENWEKSFDFWFKTQIPNFIDGSRLIGQFDRLVEQFLVGFQFKIQIPKFDEWKMRNQSVFLVNCSVF
jgi:hypothetical protein